MRSPCRARHRSGWNVFATVSLAVVAMQVASPAYAYVDPGTGGMLVQFVTGGVAGLLVLVRLYWSRLTGSARDTSAQKPSKENPSSSAPAARNDSV